MQQCKDCVQPEDACKCPPVIKADKIIAAALKQIELLNVVVYGRGTGGPSQIFYEHLVLVERE